MNGWFRSWHGAPTDIKYLVVAKQAGVGPVLVSAVMWALLDHASQAEDRGSIAGFDVETYCAFAQCDETHVTQIINSLRDKGVITASGRLAQWERRQPLREDSGSTDRVRKLREKRKLNGNEPGSDPDKSLKSKGDPKPASSNAPSRTVTHRNAVKRNVTHGNAASRNETPDKIRTEKNRTEQIREEKKGGNADRRSGARARMRVHAGDPPDFRKELFSRGTEVLGDNAEGLLNALLTARRGRTQEVRRLLEVAAEKVDPRAYLVARITGSGHPPAPPAPPTLAERFATLKQRITDHGTPCPILLA